jgi:hypothetical protein
MSPAKDCRISNYHLAFSPLRSSLFYLAPSPLLASPFHLASLPLLASLFHKASPPLLASCFHLATPPLLAFLFHLAPPLSWLLLFWLLLILASPLPASSHPGFSSPYHLYAESTTVESVPPVRRVDHSPFINAGSPFKRFNSRLPVLPIRRVSNSQYPKYGESATPHITDTQSRRLPASVIGPKNCSHCHVPLMDILIIPHYVCCKSVNS